MHYKLIGSTFSILVVMISICHINISFARQNNTHMQTQSIQPHQVGQDHSGEKDIVEQSRFSEKANDKDMKCLQGLAEATIDILIATRNVIAMNQELINRDPVAGNYSFKGFVPAVVGSQIANNFSLTTGHRLKQTSLKVRNPSNAPDEWEKKVLKLFGSPEHLKDVGFGEILETNGKKIYRHMKPIYAEATCLQCHGKKEELRPAIRQFLKMRYPHDEAFGYKEGDLRGGISLIMSLERLGFK